MSVPCVFVLAPAGRCRMTRFLTIGRSVKDAVELARAVAKVFECPAWIGEVGPREPHVFGIYPLRRRRRRSVTR